MHQPLPHLTPHPPEASTTPPDYLHGFDSDEQNRLYRQARVLDPFIFARLDLSGIRDLLEVGCGVGAMSELILRRYPDLRLTGIDLSESQLARARDHLAQFPDIKERSQLLRANASDMAFVPRMAFDGVFLCWVLEHVSNPERIVAEARRRLAPVGRIFITEVANQSLFISPRSAALDSYWNAYNNYQQHIGGDPFVGARLGDLLHHAGFKEIQTWVHTFHWDARLPTARTAMLDYWTSLLLSGAAGLVKSGRIAPNLVKTLTSDMARIKSDPRSIFFYTFVQATAVV